jgi:hypothetical protein
MKVNLLKRIEQQICDARPDYNRVHAFRALNDLEILDSCQEYGGKAIIEVSAHAAKTLRAAETLATIGEHLPLPDSLFRQRAQHLIQEVLHFVALLQDDVRPI